MWTALLISTALLCAGYFCGWKAGRYGMIENSQWVLISDAEVHELLAIASTTPNSLHDIMDAVRWHRFNRRTVTPAMVRAACNSAAAQNVSFQEILRSLVEEV